jgi:hypothetical protein
LPAARVLTAAPRASASALVGVPVVEPHATRAYAITTSVLSFGFTANFGQP